MCMDPQTPGSALAAADRATGICAPHVVAPVHIEAGVGCGLHLAPRWHNQPHGAVGGEGGRPHRRAPLPIFPLITLVGKHWQLQAPLPHAARHANALPRTPAKHVHLGIE